MVYTREGAARILDEVKMRGWNMYEISFPLRPLAARVSRGPVRDLKEGRQYELLPIVDNPADVLQIQYAKKRVILRVGVLAPSIVIDKNRRPIKNVMLARKNTVISTEGGVERLSYNGLLDRLSSLESWND